MAFSGLFEAAPALAARHASQPVVDFDRGGLVNAEQGVEGAADRVQLAGDQHFIATMQLAAIHDDLLEAVPVGIVQHAVGCANTRECIECGKDIDFAGLHGLEGIEVLGAQRLEFLFEQVLQREGVLNRGDQLGAGGLREER